MQLRNSLLISALCLSLGNLPASAAGAQPETQPAQLTPSSDRGIYAEEVGGPLAAPVMKTTPAVKPPGPRTQPKPNSNSKAPGSSPAASQVSSGKQADDTNSSGKSPVLPGTSSLIPVAHGSTGTLTLNARLNKAGAAPHYKVGERMEISVTPSSDCNLVVMDFDAEGNLTQLFPNQYQPDGLARAGSTVVIGGNDSPFDYQVSGKGGLEHIFIYAYPAGETSPLTIALAPASNSPFRSASLSLDQYRDLVNNSKVFFARGVEVVPKKGARPVAATPASCPNKIELSYTVEK